MAIVVKTSREIDLMRESCHKLHTVLCELKSFIKAGVSTLDVSDKGEEVIRKLGGVPNFKNYNGFPAAVCVSVNEEVVHGIPSKDKILQEGDIVSVDCGLIWQGYHSDAARTFGVGQISEEDKKLIIETRQSFFEGIKYAKDGGRLYDISNAIDNYISQFGYGIVQDLTGHGIGLNLHEDPAVPNFRQSRRGPRLQKGMTLAIEPMINAGNYKVKWLKDGWTVVSADGSRSAHYENTIAVTEGEPEILTLLSDDSEPDFGGM